jgi:glycerol-3-phosphate dehydrogenase
MAQRGAISLKKEKKDLSRSRFQMALTKEEWEKSTGGVKTGLNDKTMNHIFENFGKGSQSIVDSVKKEPSLGDAITAGQPNIRAELDYSLKYEMVTRLKDFLLRRSNLSLHQRDKHESLAKAAASEMAKFLGWNKKRVDEEVAEYVRIAEKNRFFLNK